MGQDPHPTKPAPGKALYASLAASTPVAGASRRSEGLCGPHRVPQGFRPARASEEQP